MTPISSGDVEVEAFLFTEGLDGLFKGLDGPDSGIGISREEGVRSGRVGRGAYKRRSEVERWRQLTHSEYSGTIITNAVSEQAPHHALPKQTIRQECTQSRTIRVPIVPQFSTWRVSFQMLRERPFDDSTGRFKDRL